MDPKMVEWCNAVNAGCSNDGLISVKNAILQGGSLLSIISNGHRTPLMIVIIVEMHTYRNKTRRGILQTKKRLEILEWMLNQPEGLATINIPDYLGNTLLHYAMECHVDFTRILLNYNPDLYARNDESKLPLEVISDTPLRIQQGLEEGWVGDYWGVYEPAKLLSDAIDKEKHMNAMPKWHPRLAYKYPGGYRKCMKSLLLLAKSEV